MDNTAQENLLASAEALAQRSLVFDTLAPTTNGDHLSASSNHPVFSDLQNTCEDLWNVVQQTYKEMEQSPIQPSPVHQHTADDTSLSNGLNLEVLKAKGRQLQAEIENIKQCPVRVLPDDPDVQYEVLHKDLEESISQLQETLSFVRTQRKEMEADIKREDGVHGQLLSVKQVLQDRLDEDQEQPDEEQVEVKYFKQLESKVKKAEKYQKQLMTQLAAFVDKHFPLPSEKIFNEVKKKLRSADRRMSLDNALPLKSILQDLMNKCIDEPSDPYVTIDHRYWPPYIELLLRCQIVLRHPDNEKQIKLVPFHL